MAALLVLFYIQLFVGLSALTLSMIPMIVTCVVYGWVENWNKLLCQLSGFLSTCWLLWEILPDLCSLMTKMQNINLSYHCLHIDLYIYLCLLIIYYFILINSYVYVPVVLHIILYWDTDTYYTWSWQTFKAFKTILYYIFCNTSFTFGVLKLMKKYVCTCIFVDIHTHNHRVKSSTLCFWKRKCVENPASAMSQTLQQ